VTSTRTAAKMRGCERQIGARMQILIVPGLGGSGPDHWQSHGAVRIPVRGGWGKRIGTGRSARFGWLEQLAEAIESAPGARSWSGTVSVAP